MLDDTYRAAWRMGLKTTYYLRTLAASQVEKSTLDAGRYGFTQQREYRAIDGAPAVAQPVPAAPALAHEDAMTPPVPAPVAAARSEAPAPQPLPAPAAVWQRPAEEISLCRIDDPDCEACQ
jgi:ribonucleoside-diphosphate reductase alpha chain